MSFSPAPTQLSAAELRHAVGHFATGVAVVVSDDATHHPVGTTVSAVCSVSLDPPLILVCLDQASATLAAVRASRAFTINVLAAEHEHVSANFARRGAAANWDLAPHARTASGGLALEDAVAVLECSLEHDLPGGDHAIIVGRVLDARADPLAAPLLHFRGAYARLDRA